MDACLVGTSHHGLYALRADSGSTLWRFEAVQRSSAPLYDPDLDVVYLGPTTGRSMRFTRATDASCGATTRAPRGARRPVRAGEMLIVANAADNLFALDRRTGATAWHVHRAPALGMEVSGYAGPALDGQTVFCAFSDGHVAAYDVRDGSDRWLPVDLSAEAEQAKGIRRTSLSRCEHNSNPGRLGIPGARRLRGELFGWSLRAR